MQRVQLDFIKSLNEAKLKRDQFHPEVEGVIESYELAFRMQAEAPEAVDISKETAATRDMYGIGKDPPVFLPLLTLTLCVSIHFKTPQFPPTLQRHPQQSTTL